MNKKKARKQFRSLMADAREWEDLPHHRFALASLIKAVDLLGKRVLPR